MCRRTAERALDRILRHAPRHVGGAADAIDHGTGHAKTGRVDAILREQKRRASLVKTLERGGLIEVFADRLQLAADGAKHPEMSFGAADIPGQYHSRHRSASRSPIVTLYGTA